MAINLKLSVIIVGCLLLASSTCCASWTEPITILRGSWGSGPNEFGLREGDTEDVLPVLSAVLDDGKIIITDLINKREKVYNKDGNNIKNVPWVIKQNNADIDNPELLKYQYINVQGYSSDGSVWLKDDMFYLKDVSGVELKSSKKMPAELCRQVPIDNKTASVKCNNLEWRITDLANKYIIDKYSNLYGIGNRQIIRYASNGNAVSKVELPQDTIQSRDLSSDYPDDMEIPKDMIIESYGEPLVAPNGDVYVWKRTQDMFQIIKWSWQTELPN